MGYTCYYFAPQNKRVEIPEPAAPYYVDCIDPRFTYVGNWLYDPSDSDVIWKSGHGVYAYPNEVVTVSLTFTGQRFTLWSPSTSQPGVAGGQCVVYVDGVEIARPSMLLDNPDAGVPNIQSWAWYVSPILPYGEHTLTLGMDGNGVGYMSFDGAGIEPTV